MLTRLFLTITQEERIALMRLALEEKRNTRQQAAKIIREELERRGLVVRESEIKADAPKVSAHE